MDYLKKTLNKQKIKNDYEEIDTRLASGWYVDSLGSKKRKNIKQVKFLLKFLENYRSNQCSSFKKIFINIF